MAEKEELRKEFEAAFDRGVERRGTNCVKWEADFIKDGVTPMWIADMDFAVAPDIEKNLQRIASQGAFGYQFLSEQYYDSIISWMQRRHGYALTKEEIRYVPNVVLGLFFAVQTVSEAGDEILLTTPVYGPFYKAVAENGRKIVETKLINTDGYYTIDFEDMEKQITPKTKALMFCNPHNPSGRVWTEEELRKVADICVRHGLYIISDDIHSELVSKDAKHTFIPLLSEEARSRSIVLTSPSKAFNLAAIHVANCFISDPALREKYWGIAENSHAAENNAFAEAALCGAYSSESSEVWLDTLNDYIEGNTEFFVKELREKLPEIGVRKPEGTYLVWADLRKLPIEPAHARDFVLNDCGIAVNEGTFFGADGNGFVRFNLACPRSRVEEAVKKLAAGVRKIRKG